MTAISAPTLAYGGKTGSSATFTITGSSDTFTSTTFEAIDGSNTRTTYSIPISTLAVAGTTVFVASGLGDTPSIYKFMARHASTVTDQHGEVSNIFSYSVGKDTVGNYETIRDTIGSKLSGVVGIASGAGKVHTYERVTFEHVDSKATPESLSALFMIDHATRVEGKDGAATRMLNGWMVQRVNFNDTFSGFGGTNNAYMRQHDFILHGIVGFEESPVTGSPSTKVKDALVERIVDTFRNDETLDGAALVVDSITLQGDSVQNFLGLSCHEVFLGLSVREMIC